MEYEVYELFDASRKGDFNKIKFLIEKGADIHSEDDHALRWASYCGRLGIVKYLVEKGANIHAGNCESLRWASYQGYFEVVKYLIEKGGNIHANDDEALRLASQRGYFEIVKYLVDKGADKNVLSNHIKSLKYLALLDKIRNRKAIIIQRYYKAWKLKSMFDSGYRYNPDTGDSYA